MCQVNPGKVDYVKYRYWLLHDPNCTKTAMQHINENKPFAALGIYVNVHESPEEVDWYRRLFPSSFAPSEEREGDDGQAARDELRVQ